MITCIVVTVAVLVFAVPLLDISAHARNERRRAHRHAMASDPDYRRQVKHQRIMDWVVGPIFYLSAWTFLFIYWLYTGN